MIPELSDRPLSELLSLHGRVAVVTGGAAGIGAATVQRLAEAGANVVVADLDRASADATAARIATATGARVVAATLDVADTSSIVAVAELAVAQLGRLDIWVNNAAIFPATGPVIDASDELIDRLLEVNVRGTFAGAREAARRMPNGGVIVNLASTTSYRAAPGIAAYVTSKHAIVGLTKNLALELAPRDIRVVGVAPGVIDTPGVREQLAPLAAAGSDVSARLDQGPLGRGGRPDDVARVIVALASDLCAWVTGVIVPVDAGSLLR